MCKMRGIYHVIVQNRYLKYEFDIKRNITIIQGDSATGKTTLVDMIREQVLNGDDSGVNISCACRCRVIEGNTWQEQLAYIKDSIVFVDEGNRFVSSKDFAREVQKGDNYFVIVTREGLEALPYSVTEIYGIKSSGRYGKLESVYHEFYRIYGSFEKNDSDLGTLLVEDSNSGYEFFSAIAQENSMRCISAKGKSNIFNFVSTDEVDNMIIIADGAAFGFQIARVTNAIRDKNITLYLPESFEWLVLSSGIIYDNKLQDLLSNTSSYVDSKEFFSWERFFTSVLIEETKDTHMAYNKQNLNPVYLHEKNKKTIEAKLPDIFKRLHQLR